jgi:ATP-dependent exoDNAse (exonuclease V) beta subunit
MKNKKNFIVYNSSAGSGKTSTLVSEYLQIALANPYSFRNILCTTFTNNASAEMKDRILGYVKIIISGEKNDITDRIIKKTINETNLSVKQIKANAERLLQLILHKYADFSVSTIDSFFQKILRSFAFDLNLSLQFNLELDSDTIVSNVFDQLIEKIGEDKFLTKIFSKYTSNKAKSEERISLEKDIREKINYLFKDEIDIELEKIAHIKKEDFIIIAESNLKKFIEIDKTLKNMFLEAISLIEKASLDHDDFKGKSRGGLLSHFTKCAQGDWSKASSPTNTTIKNIEEEDIFNASLSMNANLLMLRTNLINIFNDSIEFANDNMEEYIIRKNIHKEIWYLAVIKEIHQIMLEYKEEEEIVHISDTYKIIKNIVDKEPTPFIYERVGEYYKHFLIDEFQDTSVLQWHSFLPLIENSLASGYKNIVVGDAKQSIYRWRNSDAGQFSSLPNVFNPEENVLLKERERSLIANYQKETLGTNYRSKTEIVEFNNAFFSHLIEELSDHNILEAQLKNIYAEIKQKARNDNSGGCVDIHFFKEKKFSDIVPDEVVAIVEKLIQSGRTKKDIAILTRSNKDGSKIAKALFYKGIDVISSDSLFLGSSPKVNFILAVLSFLHNNKNAIATYEISSFLSQSFLPEKQIPVTDIKQKLSSLNNHLSVYDLGEKIIRLFQLNQKSDPFTQFLLDHLLDLSQNTKNSISDVIEWWEEKGKTTSISVPDEMDAVKISTVHKSKGLQYKIVIFPIKDQNNKLTKPERWLNLGDNYETPVVPIDIGRKENQNIDKTQILHIQEKADTEIDNINTLYVAMTRAAEQMILLVPLPKNIKEDKFTGIFNSFAMQDEAYSEESSSIVFGNKSISTTSADNIKLITNSNKNNVNKITLENFISNDWRNKIAIGSIMEKTQESESLKKARKGTIIHKGLSYIETEKDIEKSIQSLVSEGLISESEKEDVRLLFEKVCQHKDLKFAFESHIINYNEKELINGEKNILKPDRVVFEENIISVIDYKTGEEHPEHQEQINRYKETIQEIDSREINTLLVYINEENLSITVKNK